MLEVGDVCRHDEHIRGTHNLRDLLTHRRELLLLEICDGNLQAESKRYRLTEFNRKRTIGSGTEWHRIRICYLVRSRPFTARIPITIDALLPMHTSHLSFSREPIQQARMSTHFANSSAAARPMPLAAPVITATRPAWITGWRPSAMEALSTLYDADPAKPERIGEPLRLE